MAQSGKEQSALGAWPGFLITLLLVVGAGLVQTPFKPDRPEESKAGAPWTGKQDVDARLWQDPFAAVEADKPVPVSPGTATPATGADGAVGAGTGRAGAPAHSLGWLSEQLRVRQALNNGDITVLAVMVSGGPSIGSAEARRRARYAVLSGLMLEGLLPDDAQHVGYVESATADAPPERIPFEWFYPDGKAPGQQQLLLLWIDENGLIQPAKGPSDAAAAAAPPRPLGRLSAILTGLLAAPPAPAAALPAIRFRVIGPTNSTTLQFITREWGAAGVQGCPTPVGEAPRPAPTGPAPAPSLPPTAGPTATAQGVACCPPDTDCQGWQLAPMWSPFVTMPPDDMQDDAQDDPQGGAGPAAPPQGVCGSPSAVGCIAVAPPSRATRVIADDRTLVRLLVNELRSRQIAGTARVALVGQWDTDYSRSLAALFKTAWSAVDPQVPCKDQDNDQDPIEFSYMRGLDGAIPGAKPKDSAKDAAKEIERPDGDAQIDYLRRMRDALLAKDTQLRATCDLSSRAKLHCGIRAIGVLGDDYYDKLLVLQALKPVFPNATFFTTDLNAAMVHPRDNAFTRNLIVASGFGLTLREDLQGPVPPLRDSYQTALLLAVRLALDSAAAWGPADELALPPPARLFEIGRTRPVELVTDPSLKAQDGDAFARPNPVTPTQAVGPAHDPHPADALNADFRVFAEHGSPVFLAALGVAGLLAALLMVLTVGPVFLGQVTKDLHSHLGSDLAPARWPLVLAWALAVAALGALGYFAALDLRAGGEPFSLIEGVSVWPSEVLRVLAALGALFALITGHRRLCRTRHKIGADFALLPPGREPQMPAADPSAGTAGPTPPGDPTAATVPATTAAPADPVAPNPATRCGHLLQATEEGDARPAPGAPVRRAQDIWDCYLGGCHPLWKLLTPKSAWPRLPEDCTSRWGTWSIAGRVSTEVILFLLVAWGLMLAFGFPNHPVRSESALDIDVAVIMLSLIPFLLLLFYMVDATRQTLELGRTLADPVRWPNRTLYQRGLTPWLNGDALDAETESDIEWLEVRLIARVTGPVGDLVWYPVLVLIVMALARHPLLDAWDLPPALLMVMLVAILYAVGCAWALRNAAEKIRKTALRNLAFARLRAQGEGAAGPCIAQLDAMQAAISAERDGAFRPFSQQPVVQALLTLASSISGLALVQYASLVNL